MRLLHVTPSYLALIAQFTAPGISGPVTVKTSNGSSRRSVCHLVASDTTSSPSRSVSGRKLSFWWGSKGGRIEPICAIGPSAAATTATSSAAIETMPTRSGRPGRFAVSTSANSAPSSIRFCCLAAGMSASAATTAAMNTAAKGMGGRADPCDSIRPTMKMTDAGTRLAAGTNVVTSRQATRVP